jgi:hypothetical protein
MMNEPSIILYTLCMIVFAIVALILFDKYDKIE